MSRRCTESESSLELLLDTISNTFGGVVFMAILVAILLQQSTKGPLSTPKSTIPQTELMTLQADLAQTIADVKQQRLIADVQNKLVKQFAAPDTHRLLEELHRLEKKRDDFKQTHREILTNVARTQSEINQIANELVHLESALKETHEEIRLASKALRAEVESRQQTTRLPRMRATRKHEVVLMLRYGKIYFARKPGASLFDRRVNTDEFVVVESSNSMRTITPKPYAGTELLQTPAATEDLRSKLEPYDPKSIYFAIGIWEDTFGDFVTLKNILIELGFEYRLIPVTDGEVISESSRVNPKVQ